MNCTERFVALLFSILFLFVWLFFVLFYFFFFYLVSVRLVVFFSVHLAEQKLTNGP